jgi:hypothetical protein
MFPTEWLREFIFWCSLPILVLLGVILVRRGQYRKFPVFFTYVAVNALSTTIRLVAYVLTRPTLLKHPLTYTYIFFISGFVTSVLALVAVYEIFVKRLFVGFYKVRFYRYLFPCAALTILLLAALTAMVSPDQPWKLVGVADRVVIFIRLVSLGFFTFLMIVMGRAWARHELAIVFGFGIIAAATFFTSAIWVQHRDKDSLLIQAPTVAWDIACLIWLIAFGRRESSTQQDIPKPIDPEVLQEAKRWEGTLKDWLVPPKKK